MYVIRLAASLILSLLYTSLGYSVATNSVAYKVNTLKNGLEIISMEDHKVPLITIVLTVKAGSFTESRDITGLTHLWEHMFFKGNKRIPDQETFNKRIRQLGIVYNGDTSAEKVRYYFTLPAVFLDDGLQFMADAITSPLLDKVELEKERVVVLDEYDRAASQPGFDLYRIRRDIIYGDLSFLRNPLGERPIIEKATRDQLFRIKDEVFVPANSALMIAGDFSTTELLKLAEKLFSNWENPKDWRSVKAAAFPAYPKSTEIVLTSAMAQNVDYTLVFKGPKAREQTADTYAADVLINLLSQTTGKFYQKFIDSGLTLSSGLTYQTQSQAGELWVYAQCAPEKTKKVQKALLAEIDQWAKKDYFTKNQLEDVRRQLLIEHKHDLNRPSEYIKTLAFWWPVTGLDYYGSYLENLQKVELKDISAFVKKYLIGKDFVSSILLSPESAKIAGVVDNSKEVIQKFNLKL